MGNGQFLFLLLVAALLALAFVGSAVTRRQLRFSADVAANLARAVANTDRGRDRARYRLTNTDADGQHVWNCKCLTFSCRHRDDHANGGS